MFEIGVIYETGNSFTRCVVTDEVPALWKNLDVAKENLLRIKEHYEMYLESQNENEEKVLEKYKNERWFCGEFPLIWFVEDNGTIFLLRANWVGYVKI